MISFYFKNIIHVAVSISESAIRVVDTSEKISFKIKWFDKIPLFLNQTFVNIPMQIPQKQKRTKKTSFLPIKIDLAADIYLIAGSFNGGSSD